MISAVAYILAGGKSTRFGADKARARLDGEPLIARLSRSMSVFFSCRVIVVADAPGKYADLGLETIADQQPDLGPLGGLLTGLSHASASHRLVPFAACDQLDLGPSIWQRLLDAQGDGADAVAFRDERWQPLPGLYRSTLLPLVQSHIAVGKLSLQELLDHAGAVSPVRLGGQPTAHANTRAELERFRRSLTAPRGWT